MNRDREADLSKRLEKAQEEIARLRGALEEISTYVNTIREDGNLVPTLEATIAKEALKEAL